MPRRIIVVVAAGLGFAAGIIAGTFEQDPPQGKIVFAGCSIDDDPVTCTWHVDCAASDPAFCDVPGDDAITATWSPDCAASDPALCAPQTKTSKCIYGIESGAVVRCEGIGMLPPIWPKVKP